MMRTRRKDDDKDTSEAEPEGHSNTNATPPRPPTPPKPEGKDSQLDSKIDSLEEKIRLIQGLNSFGNTDFSSMSWFPNMTVPPKFKAPEFEKYNGRGDPMIHLQMYCRKMAPYADNEPLLIQTFQDTLTGNAAEWYSQLKKISHWKELADTFLAQYGFNSQIAPDRFDLQRMEKKSNETFREYAQRWREKAARARPPLDEREMIKIFVDTLKNPLLRPNDGITNAVLCRPDTAEQAAKKAPTKRKEGDVQMIGRNNGRPRQVLPTFTMQPIQPRPIQAPAPTQAPAPAPAPQMPARPEGNQPNDNRWLQKRAKAIHAFTYAYDRVIPHPDREEPNLTYCPETLTTARKEGISTQIRPAISTLENLKDYLTSPPILCLNTQKEMHRQGPSTGDACEYHSGARGHSLECCEEFKKKVTDLMENGIVGREEIPSKGSRQPDDPSEFDWYAEINLDDIVEDEMDLDNLQDEEADWGYFMEDDTDEWRDVDLHRILPIPVLDSATWYGEKMALHLENELLMISVFPESLSKQTAAWFYQLRNLTGWDDLVIVEIKEESDMSSLPALAEREEEEEPIKTPLLNIITTTSAEEEDAGPMVEGLSIHTIAGEEDSTTTPPTRHCQQGEEVKTWTCVPLLQRVSSSDEITRKTSNDPHVSKIDNKTDCSLDNIDNSDEEIELPNDILEALERQDEGSKPNIEELEIVNLADEGEEPREVKIGTRCATEQKEGTHCTVKRVPRDLRLVLPRHARPRHRHSGPQDPAKARMQARQTSTATDEARSHFEDQGRGGKAIEGRFPKHSNLFGLGSQYSPGAEERTEKSECAWIIGI
uniref:Retrotransposon gag domain-containing protein n=1 Tax=Fagus sylvatica TaxID=28930 RepID=A0A2N9HSQ0_FAGSY